MSCFAHCPALSHLEKVALGRLARQAAFRFGFGTVDCAFGCSRWRSRRALWVDRLLGVSPRRCASFRLKFAIDELHFENAIEFACSKAVHSFDFWT